MILLLFMIIILLVTVYLAIALTVTIWPYSSTKEGLTLNSSISGTVDLDISIMPGANFTSGSINYVKVDKMLLVFFNIGAEDLSSDTGDFINITFEIPLGLKSSLPAGSILAGSSVLNRPLVGGKNIIKIGDHAWKGTVTESNIGSTITLVENSPIKITLSYIFLYETIRPTGLGFSGSFAVPLA